MKLCIFAALSVTLFAYVITETCKSANDCTEVICFHNSSNVICEKDECTCEIRVACTDINDCHNIGSCEHHNQNYHCLDKFCKCLDDKHHGPGHGPGPGNL